MYQDYFTERPLSSDKSSTNEVEPKPPDEESVSLCVPSLKYIPKFDGASSNYKNIIDVFNIIDIEQSGSNMQAVDKNDGGKN